jgi:putative MFS transporter
LFIHGKPTNSELWTGQGVTFPYTLTALCVGFVNFGVLLWLPGSPMREGRSMGSASKVIASSTLIAAPTTVVAAWLCSIWSTERTLLLALGVTTPGPVTILLSDVGCPYFLKSDTARVLAVLSAPAGSSPCCCLIPPRVTHCHATGCVAGFRKSGGLIAHEFGVLGLVRTLRVAAGAVAVPRVLAMLLLVVLGRETHARDLRELETVGPSTRNQ